MMHLLNLIKDIENRSIRHVFLLSIISAISNTAMMLIVIISAENITKGGHPSLIQCFIFLGFFTAYYYTERKALMVGIDQVQSSLSSLRLIFVDSIRKSQLYCVETYIGSQTFSSINKVTSHITNVTPQIIDTIQQIALILFAGFTLAWLSPFTILIFIFVCSVAIFRYKVLYKRFDKTSTRTARTHEDLKALINGCVQGAKEVSMSTAKKSDLLCDIEGLLIKLSRLTDLVAEHISQMNIIGALAMYGLLGAACFILPKVHPENRDIIFQVVPALFFIFGPLVKTINQIPLIAQVEAELSILSDLQKKLESFSYSHEIDHTVDLSDFISITYTDLKYSYESEGDSCFTLGPINFSIKRGELVFITGGNGSGKSTFLRLICGLYERSDGIILVDNITINKPQTRNLNNLFSSVFMNFHISSKIFLPKNKTVQDLYGILDTMELPRTILGDSLNINPLSLSTGQKKRLALALSILEDKPIYILDEWAAEQDVYFRDKFYNKILSDLRKAGKTIIVVSHDDRFWGVADRVIKLEQGKTLWEKKGYEINR